MGRSTISSCSGTGTSVFHGSDLTGDNCFDLVSSMFFLVTLVCLEAFLFLVCSFEIAELQNKTFLLPLLEKLQEEAAKLSNLLKQQTLMVKTPCFANKQSAGADTMVLVLLVQFGN